MPEIHLGQLEKGKNWDSKLNIMMGWHDFKGTLKSSYKVLGKIKYEYKNLVVPDVWKIEVLNTHSKLGQYKSWILFDKKQLGFLRIDNSFHDGRRIILSLLEVKTIPNSGFDK